MRVLRDKDLVYVNIYGNQWGCRDIESTYYQDIPHLQHP